MSIIIKGMDMPKDCWECQMFGTWEEVGKFSCFLGAKVKDIDIRAIDCPLVEIPTPHGRMIDADALFEAMGLDTVKEVMLRNWKFTTAWGVPIIETEE